MEILPVPTMAGIRRRCCNHAGSITPASTLYIIAVRNTPMVALHGRACPQSDVVVLDGGVFPRGGRLLRGGRRRPGGGAREGGRAPPGERLARAGSGGARTEGRDRRSRRARSRRSSGAMYWARTSASAASATASRSTGRVSTSPSPRRSPCRWRRFCRRGSIRAATGACCAAMTRR